MVNPIEKRILRSILMAPSRRKYPEKSIKCFNVGMALESILSRVTNPFQLLETVPSQSTNQQEPQLPLADSSNLEGIGTSPVGQGKNI
jgi:hypothetical protein